MRFLLTTILAAVTVSSSVTAGETRVVPANRPSAVFLYYTATNDTCYGGGKPNVHVTGGPAHGTITTAWKAFRMGKESGKCAGKATHGTLVVYHPAPGYHGPDKVSLIFSGGDSAGYFLRPKEWTVDIMVK